MAAGAAVLLATGGATPACAKQAEAAKGQEAKKTGPPAYKSVWKMALPAGTLRVATVALFTAPGGILVKITVSYGMWRPYCLYFSAAGRDGSFEASRRSSILAATSGSLRANRSSASTTTSRAGRRSRLFGSRSSRRFGWRAASASMRSSGESAFSR